jgi:hypothetical protein
MSEPHALFRSIAGESKRFRRLLSQAQTVQERRLQSLLERNAHTQYGRRFGFAEIRCSAEYRARVPETTYADLQPYIERMLDGTPGVLVDDAVVAFEETSGSTGACKYIPYTEAGLDAFRRALSAWLDDLAAAFPAIARGRSYWAISPIGRAPRVSTGGIPIGLPSDAGYLGARLAPLVADTLAVPPAVGAIRDIEAWRDCTCLHLLACADLALVSVWSPTFLADLLEHLHAQRTRLTALLAQGHGGVAADRSRADDALRILAAQQPDLRALWPQLALVSCWDQGASGAFADALRHTLHGVLLQGKGLLATEGVVSIPLSDMRMPVLAIESGFYEFRGDSGRVLLAGELTTGCEYAVLMTTESGLYRYAIGDRVRVHGFAGEAPLLEFIGRGSQVSDLCGEKLSEDFVAAGLAPLRLRFALVAPADAPARGYSLFVDAAEVGVERLAAVASHAEQALCCNPQYAYARRVGQLAPLAVQRCERPLQTWLDAGLERGQTLSVVKLSALSPQPGWASRFNIARV